MKLIDLLVRELPKRGGWPEGAIEAGFLCSDTILYFVDENGDCPSEWRINMGESVEDNDVEISMNQYQSALAASQKVEWSGDGLPTVGCECEMQDSKGAWLPVVIIAKNDGFTFGWSYDYRIVLFGDKADEFRPLRSEADKKRDAAAKEMARHANDDENRGFDAGLRNCLSIYDAIAAGKIPGVKLED